MLGTSALGQFALGQYAATTSPDQPTFPPPLTLAGTGFRLALGDTLSGSTADTAASEPLTGAGFDLALTDTLTSQVD